MRFWGNEHLSPVLFIKTFKRKEVGVEIHVHAQLIWRRKKNTILYYFFPPQQYKQCLYHKWHRFHHITEVWLPRLPVNFLHHFPYTGYLTIFRWWGIKHTQCRLSEIWLENYSLLTHNNNLIEMLPKLFFFKSGETTEWVGGVGGREYMEFLNFFLSLTTWF